MFSARLLLRTCALAVGLFFLGFVLAGCRSAQAPRAGSGPSTVTPAATEVAAPPTTASPASPLATPTTAVAPISPLATAFPGGAPASPLATPAVEVPGNAAAAQTLTEAALGFSLARPSGYTAERPNAAELVLTAPQAGDGARLFVKVTPSDGRSAAQVADALEAEVKKAMPGYAVQRINTRLGGQDAVRLDNMPGQDIGRQVVAVHGNRLYTLTFVPADPNAGQAYRQMEDLYRAVLASFAFLPSS